jgi:hypothetical protein
VLRPRARKNLAVITDSFAALSRDDLAAHLANCHDDVVVEFPYATPPVRISGKASLATYLANALSLFSLELEITNVIEGADPSLLVLEYTSSGLALTTKRPYANTYIGLFQFTESKIVLQREYYNPTLASEALAP